MTLEQFAQAVAVTVGLATLGTVAWKLVVRPIITFLTRLEEFLQDWNGTAARPGHPRQTGVMERLQQLENNGGTSVKDVVDRTSAAVEHLNNKVDAINQDRMRHQVEASHRDIAIERLCNRLDDHEQNHHTPENGDTE